MNCRMIWVLAGCLLLSSCSNSGDDENFGASKNETEREDTVFDPMLDTMDRAAGVEDLSMSRKEEMDRAIDGSE